MPEAWSLLTWIVLFYFKCDRTEDLGSGIYCTFLVIALRLITSFDGKILRNLKEGPFFFPRRISLGKSTI
jgi:hypothetical protein